MWDRRVANSRLTKPKNTTSLAAGDPDTDVASPAQLRRLAAEKRARAKRLEAEADAYDNEARDIELARARARGLTAGLESGTVKAMAAMPAVQRKIRSAAAVEPDDEFISHVHTAFPSMTAMAKKCGVSVQFLSAVRAGRKKMPDELAERIERLIGYPASKWRS
jgi:type IV pilus biogenesis protein CpaD/CtpE